MTWTLSSFTESVAAGLVTADSTRRYPNRGFGPQGDGRRYRRGPRTGTQGLSIPEGYADHSLPNDVVPSCAAAKGNRRERPPSPIGHFIAWRCGIQE